MNPSQVCPCCTKTLQFDGLGVLRCYNRKCQEFALTAKVEQPIDARDPLAERETHAEYLERRDGKPEYEA